MDELTGDPALTQGTATGDLARAIAFLHAFAQRKAPVRRPVPGGFAVLDDRYPGSYDDNKLIIRETPGDDGLTGREAPGDDGLLARESSGDDGLAARPAPGDALERAAEPLMTAADEALATRAHRLVCIDDDQLGTACVPAFAAMRLRTRDQPRHGLPRPGPHHPTRTGIPGRAPGGVPDRFSGGLPGGACGG